MNQLSQTPQICSSVFSRSKNKNEKNGKKDRDRDRDRETKFSSIGCVGEV